MDITPPPSNRPHKSPPAEPHPLTRPDYQPRATPASEHTNLPAAMRGQPSARVPPFMELMEVCGLFVCFDAAALVEYRAAALAYDEVFAHAAEALAAPLARLGQCPIFVHGLEGCWQWGAAKKRAEEGVDLGEGPCGIAYFGNLEYDGYGYQEEAVFLINMPAAILRHPTVLIHELTHTFHDIVGFDRTPELAVTFGRAIARKPAIVERFVRGDPRANPRQFEVTFANEREFAAYLSEALHSRPSEASRCGIAFEAPAFPRTCAELLALDDEMQLGFVDALALALGRRPQPPQQWRSRRRRQDAAERAAALRAELAAIEVQVSELISRRAAVERELAAVDERCSCGRAGEEPRAASNAFGQA